MIEHVPVMVEEVMEYLNIKDKGIYCDLTLGGGGHSKAILERGGKGIKVIGIDQDRESLEIAMEKLAPWKDQVIFVHDNFRNIDKILERLSISCVDGVIGDLGVSTIQLENPERGFSFSKKGPLDMRMDRSSGRITLKELISKSSERELSDIIINYGEEKKAKKIAHLIKEWYKKGELNTTEDLAKAIRKALGRTKFHYKDAATRTFQALRIAINDELNALEELMQKLPFVLGKSGRAVFLSFHSLEDRIVKHGFKYWAHCRCPKQQSYCNCGGALLKILTPKPISPSKKEQSLNPRSRSAKLRAAEKIK